MESRVLNEQKKHFIKVARGERVVETLTTFCEERSITHASFTAIGAVEQTSMGYYDLKTHTYKFSDYPDVMEVVSMIGNVALVDGKPFLHVHAVFTDTNNQALGGHVQETVVAGTLEVFLSVYNEPMERQLDDDTGLKLLAP